MLRLGVQMVPRVGFCDRNSLTSQVPLILNEFVNQKHEKTRFSRFYGKRSFSVTTPCARPTARVNTERLAERETFLYRLGSELNRTVLNSCGNPIIRSGKTRDFCAEPGFFANGSHSHQKRSQKRKLTIFGNTKQAIQDYDTVFDNSIPFRKNDLLRITYFRIPGVPGLHFVPWHQGSGCLGAAAPVTGAAADEYNLNVVDCNESVTVARLSSISVSGVLGGTPSRRRQT